MENLYIKLKQIIWQKNKAKMFAHEEHLEISCMRDIVHLNGNSKCNVPGWMDGLPPTFLQCFEIPEEEMIKVTLTKLQPSVTTPRNS